MGNCCNQRSAEYIQLNSRSNSEPKAAKNSDNEEDKNAPIDSIRNYLILLGQLPTDSNWNVCKRITYYLWRFVIIFPITLVPIFDNTYSAAVRHNSTGLYYYGVDWIITFLVPFVYLINAYVLRKSKSSRKILNAFYGGDDKKEITKQNFRRNVRAFIYLTVFFILLCTIAYIFASEFAFNSTEHIILERTMQVLFCVSFPFRLGTVSALVVYFSTVCFALKEKINEFINAIRDVGLNIEKKRNSVFKFNQATKIQELQDDYSELRNDIKTLNKELQWFYFLFFLIVGATYPLYLMFLIFRNPTLSEIALVSSWVAPYFIFAAILIYSLASVDNRFSKIPVKLNFKAKSQKEKVEDINIWRESLMDANKGCFTINLCIVKIRITFGILFTLVYSGMYIILKTVFEQIL